MPKFIIEEVIERKTQQTRVYEVVAPDAQSAVGALDAPANKNNNEIGRTAEVELPYEDGTPTLVFELE